MSSIAGDPASPGPAAHASRPGVWLTDLSLVAMALIWGVNFSVVKYATSVLHPLAFNSVRVALAAVTLALITVVTGRRWPDRRTTLVLLGLGIIGNGFYQVFFVEGISMTRAGDAALVIAATPALIALIGRLRCTEQVAARGWTGIGLSILGIGLVAYGAVASTTGESTLLGNLLILCGSACWAVYTVYLKPYTHAIDGVTLSTVTMIGGAIPLGLVSIPALSAAVWSAVPATAWWAILYSGLGALVIAYLFWYRGVRTIGPTRTAMYSNLQPVFALIVAWLMLGEVPTVWQTVGAASVMSGLLLTRK